MSTALILHPSVIRHEPANSRPSLETTGPAAPPSVRHRPGFFLGTATFDEFLNHRERYCVIHDQRRPRERESWEIEVLAARRIVNLIDNTPPGRALTPCHRREIRWRALIAQPHCMSDWLDDTLWP